MICRVRAGQHSVCLMCHKASGQQSSSKSPAGRCDPAALPKAPRIALQPFSRDAAFTGCKPNSSPLPLPQLCLRFPHIPAPTSRSAIHPQADKLHPAQLDPPKEAPRSWHRDRHPKSPSSSTAGRDAVRLLWLLNSEPCFLPPCFAPQHRAAKGKHIPSPRVL